MLDGSPRSAPPGPPAPARLRERQGELRAGLDAARAAGAGRGQVLVVQAPAGGGKTRLLAALAGLARSSGLQVLPTAGVALEQELPFGAALELLVPAVRALAPAERADVLTGPAAAAGPLLLERAGPPTGPGEEQMALVGALAAVTTRLARRGPLALLVDDAHWLDEPSLRLCAFLARRVGKAPILLAVATRPLPPELVTALVRSPHATLLRPAPLSRPALTELVAEGLGTEPDPAFATACERVTGGNPLLVTELVRVLRAEAVAPTQDGVDRVHRIGPEAVRWSVRTTLDALGPAAGALAQALAVLGATHDVELLFALAEVETAAGGEALGRLEASEVVVAEPDRGGLRLAHPLVAQALLQAAPSTTIGLQRRQAAQLLHRRGRDVAAAAQLLAAPGGGARWAAEALATAAAIARERAAPAEAARMLSRALAEDAGAAARPGLLTALARAQAAAGAPGAAASYRAAIAVTEAPEARADLLLGLAWAHQAEGRFADAVRASEQGLALEPADPRVAVELAAMHDAAVAWSAEDRPAAVGRLGGRQAERALTAGGQAARVALAAAGRRRLFAGRHPHGPTADLARRAWDGGALLRASTAEDPALVRVLTVFHNADLLDEALEVAEACLADAKDRGLWMAETTWTHLRGHVRLYEGRLDDCVRDLETALGRAAAGWGTWLPVTAAALVSAHLERGDPDAAARALARADAAGTHPAESPMWAVAQGARGRLALACGDGASAVVLLLEAGRRSAEELGASNPSLGPWRADAVLALDATGRREEAIALADLELAAARIWGAGRALAEALRVRAAVSDDPAARLALLQEGVAWVATGQARLEHAHAVLALGSEQQRAGAPGARERLREALDLAERCAATGLAVEAQRRLRAAGGRPRRRRLQGPEALTGGELRVARLAAGGASNREIAETLVVTPKTVAFHLGNAYRKLAIAGRGELAAALPPPG